MRVKDMCLKNNNPFIWISIFIFFFTKAVFADEKEIHNIINYLGDLKLFSSSFIQDDGESISEGEIFIGLKRVRVEYKTPSKILIILEKDKAMYYNYDLDEDEFFNVCYLIQFDHRVDKVTEDEKLDYSEFEDSPLLTYEIVKFVLFQVQIRFNVTKIPKNE